MVLYNFIKYLYLSIKYHNILNRVYNQENILTGLSQLLEVEMRKDWVGRLYGVFNPYIKNGEFDPNMMVYELGEDIPTEMAIEKYIMQRLSIASDFIKAKNLFELLTFDIKKIDNNGNYLFVMIPLPYKSLTRWLKRFLWVYSTLIIIGVILLIIF